jgi:ribosome-binding protein aMBF1 (putative translation factor)
LSDRNQPQEVDEARALLESVALLEKVAANREAKAEQIMRTLADRGVSSADLAEKLEISKESAVTMLAREAPKPPHQRAGVSEETMDKLDPLTTEKPEAV